jgi:hypothetical protein
MKRYMLTEDGLGVVYDARAMARRARRLRARLLRYRPWWAWGHRVGSPPWWRGFKRTGMPATRGRVAARRYRAVEWDSEG